MTYLGDKAPFNMQSNSNENVYFPALSPTHGGFKSYSKEA